MAVIKIPVAKTIEIEIDEVVYNATEPTMDQLEIMEELEQKEDKGNIKRIREMFVDLGIPNEALGKLGIAGVKALNVAVLGELVSGKK